MNKGVAITGMGIISSIGNTVEENFYSLINNKTGLSDIENIQTIHATTLKFGEIKKTNEALITELGIPSNNNFTRTAFLGVFAAKLAIKNARISSTNEYETGLISSTSVAGMDTTEQHYHDYFNDEKRKLVFLMKFENNSYT